ncbi:organic cation transporter protein [Amyelois transitella]|uniref:organic cation transporter protein n=1 Tax=Amyelois transitella TaxID=680683 RepID=UPI00298FAE64|nr:organic cation transporter protein [Amyelois transitella]
MVQKRASDGDGGAAPAHAEPGAALEAALDQLKPFGLYQRYVVILLCIPNLFAAMYSMNYVFVAELVPFRCVIPECEGWPSQDQFSNETVWALLPNSTCERYQPLNNNTIDSCHPKDYRVVTQECEDILYENDNTVFSEFGLGCRPWLRTLVGSVRNTALPLALLLTGYVSDLWGRRTAFCIFSGCAGALGIVKALSINYNMYISMEFFEAMLGYGFNSAGYVMVVELARPQVRAAFACATGVAYGLGGVLFALAAWGLPHWRHLLVTIHAPALLLPLYWMLLDESPRWLLARGRGMELTAVLKKMARVNKVVLNEDLIKPLESNDAQEASKTDGNPWLRLVKSRVLVGRFALCGWCWAACSFVYYGLSINSVSLAGQRHVNFALNMAMEIVASLLLMMLLERVGRKRTVFFSFLLCGVACVVPFFITHSGTGLGLFFMGKLAITCAFNSLYVFTAELFPTHARSSALAATSLVGRVGSILAPQTPLLSGYVQAMLYGGCSLSAALLVLLVPETRRAVLPQSVAAAEQLREPEAALPAPPPPPPARVVLSADM